MCVRTTEWAALLLVLAGCACHGQDPSKPDNGYLKYEIRRNLFAFAFATNHCENCLGYSIIERRQKLKEEFLDLPGPEIARLRKQGEPVTYTLNLPLVSYLGDTTGGPFEKLACVRQSKILIVECTFFDDEHHERARAGRHYHFNELAHVLQQMENEHIIIFILPGLTTRQRLRVSAVNHPSYSVICCIVEIPKPS